MSGFEKGVESPKRKAAQRLHTGMRAKRGRSLFLSVFILVLLKGKLRESCIPAAIRVSCRRGRPETDSSQKQRPVRQIFFQDATVVWRERSNHFPAESHVWPEGS